MDGSATRSGAGGRHDDETAAERRRAGAGRVGSRGPLRRGPVPVGPLPSGPRRIVPPSRAALGWRSATPLGWEQAAGDRAPVRHRRLQLVPAAPACSDPERLSHGTTRRPPLDAARPSATRRPVAAAAVRLDPRVVYRRRLVALLAVGFAAVLVVLVLGLLASAARSASVPAQTTQVRVASDESLWQIARRAAPKADPDVVVERIVTQNQLTSAAVTPGQVLSVPTDPAR